jgi:hypothetical protein
MKMTKKKKKKKKKTTTKRIFSTFLESFRHPLPPLDHPITKGILRFGMLVFVLEPGTN